MTENPREQIKKIAHEASIKKGYAFVPGEVAVDENRIDTPDKEAARLALINESARLHTGGRLTSREKECIKDTISFIPEASAQALRDVGTKKEFHAFFPGETSSLEYVIETPQQREALGQKVADAARAFYRKCTGLGR